ncbi:phosphodiesterase [Starkeya sp. ORNL1]|uniref:phosphodiesterase n=1 Tax=Starkeya sp. ORNL1 TaxID=2709380 RepID=UPI001FEE42D9|nr:phosphodiesterase [Starkeya sp. ORNL1]
MIKLIQITDPHLVEPGELLLGLDPLARLEACLAHVNAHHADADLVVLSGDLTDDGSPAAYAALRDRLAGLKAPWRLMVGNHDDRDALLTAFPEVPSAGGFLQCSLDTRRGRVILLDTLEPGRVEGRLCPARLAWLEAELDAASAQPAYIFMHHPPFRVHLPALDAVRLVDVDAFLDVIGRHGAVRHIFAGHVHRPISGVWHGIGFSTLFGTSHQAEAIFNEKRFATSLEAPAYGVILIEPDSVVVLSVGFLEPSV